MYKKRDMFAMKVNLFAKKHTSSHYSQHGVVSSTQSTNTKKKLWRLPHVFAKMLELPFPSDTDVLIEETPQFLRFVVSCNAGCVKAHTIEILPGITKVVIKKMDGGDITAASQYQHPRFGVDLWRFRLPPWTQPDMVTAVCNGGKLIVTVPNSRGN